MAVFVFLLLSRSEGLPGRAVAAGVRVEFRVSRTLQFQLGVCKVPGAGLGFRLVFVLLSSRMWFFSMWRFCLLGSPQP